MPDFIKCFLHVKKYCRGGSSLIFCLADGLGELKRFVCCGFVLSKT